VRNKSGSDTAGTEGVSMSRAIGDFVAFIADESAMQSALVDRVQTALLAPQHWPQTGSAQGDVSVAHNANGVWVAVRGDVGIEQSNSPPTCPNRGGIGLAREPESGGASPAPRDVASNAIRRWIEDDTWQPRDMRGRYGFLLWDSQQRSIRAFTDAFRSYPIFFSRTQAGVVVASDLRLVLAALRASSDTISIDHTSLYHYLNFAYVPSPASIARNVEKLKPCHVLHVLAGSISSTRFLDTTYAEDLKGRHADLATSLRKTIVDNVTAYSPGSESKWGTFLSGGTDSSSISGMLARANPSQSVDSFSIGFAEAGYDEMAYSRIAAKHFGLNPHEFNVDETASVDAIPALVASFDEPFGNSSAIPTYYCARLARDAGKELLIAGDGGDEIFGGNERYAKDQIYGWYFRSPALMKFAGRAFSSALKLSNRHFANRVRNMIYRGSLPNPDRFYSDDSFASDHFDQLLTGHFREHVQQQASLQIQQEIFAEAPTQSELHRLMYLDLKLTIAESDLVKVIRSTRSVGVDVAFPYLDRTLVDYAGRLPDHFKVNGLKKRYLFKMAMEDILPIEIRKKKKQGFGLPIAVWLRRGGKLRDYMRDVVLSEQSLSRGYFQRKFIHDLFEQHEKGAWDYSSELFRLFMLELWHREYFDAK
jgi:asparagine synthase (glutamine-hydrolysing)